MTHKIHNADIKEWAKNYEGELFDGILCDPPYELGFMGKGWDSSGIAFDVDLWADIFKLLKPGGHLLAFSGSRTYHRMAVAIEDAGFEIRDQLIWMYGSGFPKSHNIGKSVDKILGNDREVIGVSKGKGYSSIQEKNIEQDNRPYVDGLPYLKADRTLTKGTSDYEGYGTALKPAHEPCVLARKPLAKGMTVANNVLTYGTGGLNIDGTRVGTEEKLQGSSSGRPDIRGGNFKTHKGANPDELGYYKQNSIGRFPANLIHDGSDEVEAVFPQTGKSTASSGHHRKGNVVGDSRTAKAAGQFGDGAWVAGSMHNDSGSASRYFYTAKASKRERNAGLEGFEEKRAGAMEFRNRESEKGQFEGRPQYSQNNHPTVKPLSLTKYLATLIKPPTGGRLLVPFSGSGSEMIGALQAGWGHVEGVELTEEYIPIAEARIKYWLAEMAKEDEQPKQGQLI